MHKKHGIKLFESRMEPVLLVQTRVQEGGESQNRGKGMGRTNVDIWREMPIRIHSDGQYKSQTSLKHQHPST